MVLHVFPKIGREPIRSLTGPQRLAVLQATEERGTIETAHRVKEGLGGMLRHAVATHRGDHDPRRIPQGRAGVPEGAVIREQHRARHDG